jgi:hypothetical protein
MILVVMQSKQGIILSWTQVGLRLASLKARPARILVHVSGDAHFSQLLPPHDPIFSNSDKKLMKSMKKKMKSLGKDPKSR